MRSSQDTYTLANGVKMPCIGLGTYQSPDAVASAAVKDAMAAGYRLIDTAAAYGNERGVGQGIRISGVPREEIFVTSKLRNAAHGYQATLEAFDMTLSRLGLRYLDLYLIHWPNPIQYRTTWQEATIGTWKAFEELYKAGRIRAIGVSNFYPDRLADMVAFNEIAPMVDQVETNPLNQQIEARKNMVKRGVAQEAWAPFGEGMQNMFSNPTLARIGEAHGKSVAQVILRWLTQRDIVALPKSTHKERMEENLNIFDFRLSDSEMATIAGLDTKTSMFFRHDTPEAVDRFVGYVKERAGRE